MESSDGGFRRRPTTKRLVLNTPGVDSRGGEQEAAQAAVGALALALCAAVGKRLDDLHKGLWENSGLVIDRSL